MILALWPRIKSIKVCHIERTRLIQCVSLFFYGFDTRRPYIFKEFRLQGCFLIQLFRAYFFVGVKVVMTKGNDR